MSGHSHWATIKRKKEKTDAAKGKVFTRMIREITVASREGGGDPDGNPRLRLLLDKARSVNLPRDPIERAIKRGTGEIAGENYEAVKYEGYGPEGMAIIVEALTDNRNRTVSDLRHLFTKYGGKLAETNAVGWMFEHKGVIWVHGTGHTEDTLMELLIDYNIDDIVADDGMFAIYCAPSALQSVKEGVEKSKLKIDSAELEWVAKEPISLSASTVEERAYKLLDALEELDDVQNVYANLK